MLLIHSPPTYAKCQTFLRLACVWDGRLTYLLIRVEWVDVLDGRGEELRRELRRHPDGQRHAALQGRVRRGAVVVHIVVVADLKGSVGVIVNSLGTVLNYHVVFICEVVFIF